VFSESAPAYFQGGSERGTPDWYTVLGWTSTYGQLRREGYDIATYNAANPNAGRFSSVLSNYDYNRWLVRYAGPGDWNDPDFLIAGDSGLTATQSRAQISLWAMMSAPLILSSNVASLSTQSVADLGNTGIVALDQDPLGKQGAVVSSNGTTDVLVKPLADGDRAVAFLNTGSAAETASTTTAAMGFTATGQTGCSFSVKDLWAGTTSTTTGVVSASVASDGTAVLRVTPSAGCAAATPTGQLVGNGSKCVDDSGSGTADGTPVILYACTGNANQRWAIDADGTVRTLGKCLSAQNGGTAAGTVVVLAGCTGAAGQVWQYGQGQQSGELVDRASGLCLDVYGGGSADGAELDTWTCGTHQLNQIWSLPD
jgi:alpha-galactosidase